MNRMIVQELRKTLAMLGADSFLQNTLEKWGDSESDEVVLEHLRLWNRQELDRIASVVQEFRETGFWLPGKRYSRVCQGTAEREFPETQDLTGFSVPDEDDMALGIPSSVAPTMYAEFLCDKPTLICVRVEGSDFSIKRKPVPSRAPDPVARTRIACEGLSPDSSTWDE